VTTSDALVPDARHSCPASPPRPEGTLPAISTPWRRFSAASWAARAPNCPPSPRRSPMAPSPSAASHALRGGAPTPTSGRRCTCCPLWPRRGPRVSRAHAPCRRERSSPATGLAGASSPEGPRAGSAPHRHGRVDARGDPCGGAGGRAGRRRGRRDGTASHAAGGGLGLRLPHGHAHDGDVGRHALAPRYLGGVSHAGQAERGQERPGHPRGVWSHHGAVLWG